MPILSPSTKPPVPPAAATVMRAQSPEENIRPALFENSKTPQSQQNQMTNILDLPKGRMQKLQANLAAAAANATSPQEPKFLQPAGKPTPRSEGSYSRWHDPVFAEALARAHGQVAAQQHREWERVGRPLLPPEQPSRSRPKEQPSPVPAAGVASTVVDTSVLGTPRRTNKSISGSSQRTSPLSDLHILVSEPQLAPRELRRLLSNLGINDVATLTPLERLTPPFNPRCSSTSISMRGNHSPEEVISRLNDAGVNASILNSVELNHLRNGGRRSHPRTDQPPENRSDIIGAGEFTTRTWEMSLRPHRASTSRGTFYSREVVPQSERLRRPRSASGSGYAEWSDRYFSRHPSHRGASIVGPTTPNGYDKRSNSKPSPPTAATAPIRRQ